MRTLVATRHACAVVLLRDMTVYVIVSDRGHSADAFVFVDGLAGGGESHLHDFPPAAKSGVALSIRMLATKRER